MPVSGSKKSTAAKTTKSSAQKKVTENIVLQFEGKSVSNSDLIARVKDVWKSEKKAVSDIKSLDIYVKPEESKAYYVMNGTELGSLDI